MVPLMPLHLRLRESLHLPTGPEVAVAYDDEQTYLVLTLPGRSGPCWLCAPASEVAIACVREGRASAWSVVHHSATGTVNLFRTHVDGEISQSVLLCGRLPPGPLALSAA